MAPNNQLQKWKGHKLILLTIVRAFPTITKLRRSLQTLGVFQLYDKDERSDFPGSLSEDKVKFIGLSTHRAWADSSGIR